MKTLNISWLSCNNCDAEPSRVIVQTEKGNKNRLYCGDKAECAECGNQGVIEADGENAWVEWDD
ncbi:hypothetical protein M12a_00013 [Klebsiella phage VLCpiM12a]|uniref:hypothetical protein n=1 Tax=Klebsiella phage VLCpiM12a TaxID=2874879 RepID=UPI00232CF0B8|nr:hypothetical protein PQZ58_gp13 [Klebsiella phage VLCpiM12a]UVX31524.1 hypothetical protein M12a_00013 [Klebsiella phage VLCpiM12a]